MRKIIIGLVLVIPFIALSCLSEPITTEVEIEVPVYKPTMVAVKFLHHSDTQQILQLDTIYLDGIEEKVIWDTSQYGSCVDKVQFELIEIK